MSEQVKDSPTTEEMIALYQQSGDLKLRDAIAERNLYITQILAKRYVGRGIEYEDLCQVAVIGLLQAIDRFDASYGVKFATFATQTILGEIKKHFRDTGHFIRVPKKMYEVFARADQVHKTMPYSVVSYEQTLDEDRDLILENVIGQNDDSFLLIEDKDFVYQCLQHLTGEEHTFIVARYYDALSQQQIADKMHVSQMYVSRLEKKVLKKLYEFYMRD